MADMDEGAAAGGARLPAGAAVLTRSYEGECGWTDGLFHDRRPVDALAALTDSVLRTRRVVEDCPSLDGTRATVGTFERLYGDFVRMPSASVNVRVRATVSAAPGEGPSRVILMVEDARTACADVPADGAGTAVLEATVALTRRRCDVAFASEVEPAPAVGAPRACVVRGESCCAVRLVSLEVERVEAGPSERPAVFIASDSLAQTYPEEVRPQTGWGEFVARYLSDGPLVVSHDPSFGYAAATRYEDPHGTVVVNAAMAARSARSFIAEGKLSQLLMRIRPGYVLVFHFGANDATRARPLRYDSPEEFEGFLARYVDAARDRGAKPVIVTPPPRHDFDGAGRLTVDFAEYADVERAYCAREGVDLIDLSLEGAAAVSAMGPERSRALYMKLSAGQYPNHPDGIDDSTHLSSLGARTFGRIVARGLARAVDAYGFRDDRPGPLPAKPGHLAARVVDAGGRGSVLLTWDPDPAASYYAVTRKPEGAETASVATALEPRFVDPVAPGRPDTVSYEVVAWRGEASGPAAGVAVRHAFEGLGDAGRRLGGMDLYEVDTAGIADRIAFSVRFNAHPGVASYRVVAHNAQTDQLTSLGTIEAGQVDGLHSYGVSRESGWEIYVEGEGADGLYRSDARQLPNEPPAGGKSSWEVPF